MGFVLPVGMHSSSSVIHANEEQACVNQASNFFKDRSFKQKFFISFHLTKPLNQLLDYRGFCLVSIAN